MRNWISAACAVVVVAGFVAFSVVGDWQDRQQDDPTAPSTVHFGSELIETPARTPDSKKERAQRRRDFERLEKQIAEIERREGRRSSNRP